MKKNLIEYSADDEFACSEGGLKRFFLFLLTALISAEAC